MGKGVRILALGKPWKAHSTHSSLKMRERRCAGGRGEISRPQEGMSMLECSVPGLAHHLRPMEGRRETIEKERGRDRGPKEGRGQIAWGVDLNHPHGQS